MNLFQHLHFKSLLKAFRVFLGVGFLFFGAESSFSSSKKTISSFRAKNPYYYYLLSKLNQHHAKIDDAFRYMDLAIKLDPLSSFLYEEKGRQSFEAAEILESSLDSIESLMKAHSSKTIASATLVQNYTSRMTRAVDAVKRSIALDSGNPRPQVLLAKIYSEQRQFDLALEFYQNALNLNAKDESVYQAMIEIYLVMKKPELALKVAESLHQELPESLAAYYFLGNIHGSVLKNMVKAVEIFEMGLKEDPENLRLLEALGQLYLNQGQLENALPVYQKVTRLYPLDLQNQIRLGSLYYDLKNYPEALEIFGRLLTVYPNSDRLQYFVGLSYMGQKNHAAALETLEKIGPGMSFYRDALLKRLFVYKQEGRLPEFVRISEGLIQSNPQIPEPYEALAEAYADLGDYEKQRLLLEKSIKKFPEHQNFYLLLADFYDEQGNTKKALALMQQVLNLDPNQIKALNYIGYSYAMAGVELDVAEDLLLRALDLSPENADVLDSLGLVFFKKGSIEKSIEYFEKASKFLPDHPEILEHLGDAYFAFGNREKANELYQRALSILQKEDSDEHQAWIARVRQKISDHLGLRVPLE